jgi:DNA-binding LytR/AlgR family response regulator
MTKTIAQERGREIGLGFLYWLTFLVALEPGNLLELNGQFLLSSEVLRIAGASLLGAMSAPVILALLRRFPLEAGARFAPRAAMLGLGAFALAFVLIAASCVLAPLAHVGDTRPFLTALPSELQANWLLLTFCILAFAGLASRFYLPSVERQPIETSARPEFLNAVDVKVLGRTQTLSLDDVDWIETQGNYLALHVVGGATHLIRETMAQFEAKIDPAAFARIHRRTLVKRARVRAVEAAGSGDALVHLDCGACLRMSRSHARRLRTLGTFTTS